jgi:3-hydroxy-3-methylglutaryl CoA synthase
MIPRAIGYRANFGKYDTSSALAAGENSLQQILAWTRNRQITQLWPHGVDPIVVGVSP